MSILYSDFNNYYKLLPLFPFPKYSVINTIKHTDGIYSCLVISPYNVSETRKNYDDLLFR